MTTSQHHTCIFADDVIKQLNPAVLSGFLASHEDPSIRKTHLFEGRYENIYIDEKHIPELAEIIKAATDHATQILGVDKLRAGYWMNFMPPGSITIAHRHDDDDELLSGVYYVSVPENAGNLILQDPHDASESGKIEIIPQAGLFVFFKPDVVHEVTRNNSSGNRLSIGMNFGIPADR